MPQSTSSEQTPSTSPTQATVTLALLARTRRLAQRLARYSGYAVDEGDLFGAGTLGIVHAVKRWETSGMNGEFDAYALVSARNAMHEELRARDPLSRNRRKGLRATQQATEALSQQLGREPEPGEVASTMGVSRKVYEQMSAARHVVLVELDSGVEELQSTPSLAHPAGAMQASEASVDLQQRVRRIREEIGDMPPRLVTVLRLYYDEGLTQREIGARLEVTEARVCQLLREAVESLRDRITVPAPGGKLTLSRRIKAA